MMDTIKSVLVDETVSLFTSAGDVARSGAYIYPLKGIFHLSNTKPLWRPPLSKAYPTATLGLGVTSAMFFFTYIPQVAIMSITSGPLLAPITTAFLVLTESSTITNYLARAFILKDALMDTFDGTLVSEGYEKIVANGRHLHATGDAVSRLGDVIDPEHVEKKEREKITMASLIKACAYLPLNFIPVVGTVLYVFVHGKKMGPELHERYFRLKGWDARKVREWVDRHRGAYTGLGMAAFVLEMIPFASIACSFTNTVGAALWAADIEKAIR
ncbi:EI24 domain-containing protein [Aspergillus glaucus CBS 516.65]|uniref:Outer spore wall protein RRT8 n=1 Tax=Aspergillus glaucus CBS 516.65 TaxID=1160497 RepID=A0A1L9V651_ASPGL|nr:hypothetical protein ASPGLDRAFT_52649 [Aspergillus glaucus CBS 516.65]OJJ79386.1 hypothetical protein ASPGLDRAFT_52649 [Aspergillus glaucus CBS 516.65]